MSASINETPTLRVNVDGDSFAYREVGTAGGRPLVLLHHVTAALDEWDPAVVDALAAERRVILFDNRGVGGSTGVTPDSIGAMAQDAAAFVDALGLGAIDLLGYSLGGMVAQALVRQRPELTRRIILASTSPAGGEGAAATGAVLQTAVQEAAKHGKHPKNLLFFPPNKAGQAAADAFLRRLAQRTAEPDVSLSSETIGAQLTAMASWELTESPKGLAGVKQPVLVVNGDKDIMLPTANSLRLADLLPDARLSIYPDSGHGAIFQHHELFVRQALDFLRD